MIDWLSGKLADALVATGAVADGDRDIYVYGMDVILSTAFSVAGVLAAGLLIGRAAETTLFLAFFMALRGVAGGFHASTHFRCFLIMLVAFALSMTLVHFTAATFGLLLSPVLAAVSLAVVLALAPAPHVNRPVTADEIMKFRKLSRLVAVLEWIAVMLALGLCAGTPAVSLSAALGMFSSAASVVAAHLADARIKVEK